MACTGWVRSKEYVRAKDVVTGGNYIKDSEAICRHWKRQVLSKTRTENV